MYEELIPVSVRLFRLNRHIDAWLLHTCKYTDTHIYILKGAIHCEVIFTTELQRTRGGFWLSNTFGRKVEAERSQ